MSADFRNVKSNIKYGRQVFRDVEQEKLDQVKVDNRKYGKASSKLTKMLTIHQSLVGLDQVFKKKLHPTGDRKAANNSTFWAGQMGEQGNSELGMSGHKLLRQKRKERSNNKSLGNGGFFMQKNFPTRMFDNKSITLK